MQLTEEERQLLARLRDPTSPPAHRWLDAREAAYLIELLAAHNAGAQEPAAYTSADRLKRIAERNRHVDTMWPASMRDEGDIPLYTQPQPMTFGGSHESAGTTPIGIATASEITDAARDVQDAKRYRLLRERHFMRADNPNTTAYHCVGISTSWLLAPTIDREGLDAVLDAEIERLDRAKGE